MEELGRETWERKSRENIHLTIDAIAGLSGRAKRALQ
jgi:hypothetical protein